MIVLAGGERNAILISALRVVAQFGSALDWGSRGRWFESSPPDQIFRGQAFAWPFAYRIGIPSLKQMGTLDAVQAPRLMQMDALDAALSGLLGRP